jgi:molybdopterin-guanine dinucleotide biosynthesis protein MobB
VAAVKHDAHRLRLDTPGKDSDRLFRAGATVLAHDPREGALRFRTPPDGLLIRAVRHLLVRHDVVLVEGHKRTPLPKLWLEDDDRRPPPPTVSGVLESLPRDADRPARAEGLLLARLREAQDARRVLGGILVGGRSRRMGRPKQMIEIDGTPMVERVAAALRPFVDDLVLLGEGPVPRGLAAVTRLPDVVDGEGPLAGMLAAMRWAPDAAWIFASCDLPCADVRAVEWLMARRRIGRWAVLPRLDSRVEPLLAVYEPWMRGCLEELRDAGESAPRHLGRHEKVATPRPPDRLRHGWLSVNTPAELEERGRGA